MRRFVAGLLALIGLLLVPLADAGVWMQRVVIPTGSFTDLVVEMLDEPAIQAALTARLTDEVLLRANLPSEVRPVVSPAVRTVIVSQPFEAVFRATAGALHDQLDRDDGTLSLNLDAALPQIKAVVAAQDATIATQIPDSGLPVITVVTSDDAPELWKAADLARQSSLVFPVATLVVLAAAVLVSTRRSVLLIVIGIALVAIAVALGLVINLGRDALSDVAGSNLSKDAFSAGYDVITGSFVVQSAAVAVLGLASAAVGGVLVWNASRNRRSDQWA